VSLIIFILILLVLIVVHEYGHFIVAKKLGIRVDEFGIGFPPKAWTYMRKDGTDYTLNWLPFGGFVRIFGENPDEESINGPDKDKSFVNKPKRVRAAVLVAGVVMNVLLAWVLLSAIFMIGTDIAVDETNIKNVENVQLMIVEVLEDSPANEAGLIPGDIITSFKISDGETIEYTPEIVSNFIAENSDDKFFIDIKRGEELISLSVNTEKGLILDDPERGALGISMGLVGFVQYLNPLKALIEGAKFTVDIFGLVWGGLLDFFAGLFTFSPDFSSVAGPIGIVGVVGEAAGLGITSLLFLTALISINLAIINILPIPALDGGRLLFLIIEAIKGSPIRPQIANAVHGIFFALLILLILVISFFDISRLIG
jgi:regulator of sigma E protease